MVLFYQGCGSGSGFVVRSGFGSAPLGSTTLPQRQYPDPNPDAVFSYPQSYFLPKNENMSFLIKIIEKKNFNKCKNLYRKKRENTDNT